MNDEERLTLDSDGHHRPLQARYKSTGGVMWHCCAFPAFTDIARLPVTGGISREGQCEASHKSLKAEYGTKKKKTQGGN